MLTKSRHCAVPASCSLSLATNIAGGDADNIVAYLLNEPLDNVKRVTGASSLANRQSRINRASRPPTQADRELVPAVGGSRPQRDRRDARRLTAARRRGIVY